MDKSKEHMWIDGPDFNVDTGHSRIVDAAGRVTFWNGLEVVGEA